MVSPRRNSRIAQCVVTRRHSSAGEGPRLHRVGRDGAAWAGAGFRDLWAGARRVSPAGVPEDGPRRPDWAPNRAASAPVSSLTGPGSGSEPAAGKATPLKRRADGWGSGTVNMDAWRSFRVEHRWRPKPASESLWVPDRGCRTSRPRAKPGCEGEGDETDGGGRGDHRVGPRAALNPQVGARRVGDSGGAGRLWHTLSARDAASDHAPVIEAGHGRREAAVDLARFQGADLTRSTRSARGPLARVLVSSACGRSRPASYTTETALRAAGTRDPGLTHQPTDRVAPFRSPSSCSPAWMHARSPVHLTGRAPDLCDPLRRPHIRSRCRRPST